MKVQFSVAEPLVMGMNEDVQLQEEGREGGEKVYQVQKQVANTGKWVWGARKPVCLEYSV